MRRNNWGIDSASVFRYTYGVRNKTILGAALLFGFSLSPVDAAHAIQRKHKPWLSSRSDAGHAVPLAKNHEVIGRSAEDGDPGRKITTQALQYKGTRYRYGGTTKRGMDCSGLVARVWADLKLKKIPRASSSLYKSGKPVRLANLKAGDLVFFKNTYRRGISHVGIYTKNLQFIHASSRRRGVTVDKITNPYYLQRIVGARRLYAEARVSSAGKRQRGS